jgi:hypothetical protein
MINNEKNVSGIPPFLILLPPDLAIRFQPGFWSDDVKVVGYRPALCNWHLDHDNAPPPHLPRMKRWRWHHIHDDIDAFVVCRFHRPRDGDESWSGVIFVPKQHVSTSVLSSCSESHRFSVWYAVIDTPAEGLKGWMSHTHGLMMRAIERAQILTEQRIAELENIGVEFNLHTL